jgi:2-C-methyl-D-erythritol 4-phosphate cytidylyltransferase/2-C-methyl-D-erythritol 2,4-cyclodiphosphate synthase
LNTSASVLVVAAGSGQRLGGDIPKQYRLLAGSRVRHCIKPSRHPAIDKVLVAIH